MQPPRTSGRTYDDSGYPDQEFHPMVPGAFVSLSNDASRWKMGQRLISNPSRQLPQLHLLAVRFVVNHLSFGTAVNNTCAIVSPYSPIARGLFVQEEEHPETSSNSPEVPRTARVAPREADFYLKTFSKLC